MISRILFFIILNCVFYNATMIASNNNPKPNQQNVKKTVTFAQDYSAASQTAQSPASSPHSSPLSPAAVPARTVLSPKFNSAAAGALNCLLNHKKK